MGVVTLFRGTVARNTIIAEKLQKFRVSPSWKITTTDISKFRK